MHPPALLLSAALALVGCTAGMADDEGPPRADEREVFGLNPAGGGASGAGDDVGPSRVGGGAMVPLGRDGQRLDRGADGSGRGAGSPLVGRGADAGSATLPASAGGATGTAGPTGKAKATGRKCTANVETTVTETRPLAPLEDKLFGTTPAHVRVDEDGCAETDPPPPEPGTD